MATKLESKVVRESSETADDREIIVTLAEDQTILMKLKGMKSGIVSIGIKELWDQLNNKPTDKPAKSSFKERKSTTGDPMVSLNRLRTMNATTPGKVETITRVDMLIVELLEESKTQQS